MHQPAAEPLGASSRPPFGPPELTPRQREIARLVSCGLTNQQIADGLGLAHGTVANQVANILARLAVENRTQVVAYCGSPPAPEAMLAQGCVARAVPWAEATSATRVLIDAKAILAQSAQLLSS